MYPVEALTLDSRPHLLQARAVQWYFISGKHVRPWCGLSFIWYNHLECYLWQGVQLPGGCQGMCIPWPESFFLTVINAFILFCLVRASLHYLFFLMACRVPGMVMLST